ncbi:hypothetical protein T484DRAFT_1790137 [Baffinella frigidus]|nr:hypothetical protein T484DRAFT_1790137 [Cryptophyta sp. CCMP2293]
MQDVGFFQASQAWSQLGVVSSLPLPMSPLDRCEIDRWSINDLDFFFNELRNGPRCVATLHERLPGAWQTEDHVQMCYTSVLLLRIAPMFVRHGQRFPDDFANAKICGALAHIFWKHFRRSAPSSSAPHVRVFFRDGALSIDQERAIMHLPAPGTVGVYLRPASDRIGMIVKKFDGNCDTRVSSILEMLDRQKGVRMGRIDFRMHGCTQDSGVVGHPPSESRAARQELDASDTLGQLAGAGGMRAGVGRILELFYSFHSELDAGDALG